MLLFHSCPTVLHSISRAYTDMELSRGNAGEELMDEPDFNFTNARRRSNSSGLLSQEQMRTKFEFNEPEPVFEEDLHGPEEVLHKTETSSSGGSIDKD